MKKNNQDINQDDLIDLIKQLITALQDMVDAANAHNWQNAEIYNAETLLDEIRIDNNRKYGGKI